MNDRFKFRYFNKYTNKMVEPENWQNVDGIYECIKQQVCFDGDIAPLPYDHIGNGLVFMQCTGLKDKNGKLIYEGDIIVNEKFVKYITKWNDNIGQFYISEINPSKYDNWKDWHLARHDLDYEVIGNIYQHPELLED